ncbi:MAG TPA: hypothetical protein VNA87_02580 [Actinomycetota bacterium]|nr:hypothetical protein [Actinomycetota bacterium]
MADLLRKARGRIGAWVPGSKAAHSAWIVVRWRVRGSPVPPPHIVKRMAVRRYARRYRLGALVETGTFMGQMILGTSRRFRRVYSIELDSDLAARATEMFSYHSNVQVLQGDSGERVAEVLSQLDGPALFWLDAHYSEGVTALGRDETPILRELAHILEDPRDHVLLVDDARDFVGGAYPSMDELQKFVEERRPGYRVEVADDIIRIHR